MSPAEVRSRAANTRANLQSAAGRRELQRLGKLPLKPNETIEAR